MSFLSGRLFMFTDRSRSSFVLGAAVATIMAISAVYCLHADNCVDLTACHVGSKFKDGSSAWLSSQTTASSSYHTTGTTGGTYTTTGSCTITLQSYYTAECQSETASWCSDVSTPTSTTRTYAVAYCAGG